MGMLVKEKLCHAFKIALWMRYDTARRLNELEEWPNDIKEFCQEIEYQMEGVETVQPIRDAILLVRVFHMLD
jgi:hypothetical protein